MAKKKNGKKKRELQLELLLQMAANGNPGAMQQPGVLDRVQNLLGKRPRDQFLTGALVGAALVYVLGDEQLRSKLLKAGMNLYANVVGGFEEFREQVADLKAEVEVERDASF